MYKKLVVTLLGVLLATAGTAAAETAAAQPTVWLTRLDQALERAARQDRYILVDLYAEWCGWCKVLEKDVFSTREFHDFAKDLVLLRVDVEDGAEGSALQARFGVYDLPTTLVMNADQVKIGTVSGFAPAPAFLRKLAAEIASYDGFIQSYERLKTSGDLGVLYRLAEELHTRGDGDRALVVYLRILRQIGEGAPKAAWIHFLIADAHRLAGRYGDARDALRQAGALSERTPSKNADNRELQERIDLLSARIAQESHDCEQAKSSFESFLQKHPQSSFRRDAQKTLDALRRGEVQGCA